MKVLHVAETIHGGIATYLNELMVVNAGFSDIHMSILCPFNQDDCLDENPSVNKYYFQRNSRGLISLIKLAISYFKVRSELAPDLIHIHSSFAGIIVRLIEVFNFRTNKPKIIYCSHGWSFSMETSYFKRKFFALIEVFFQYFTDEIICISEYEKKIAVLFGINEKKCTVIYNGINKCKPEEEALDVFIDKERINGLFVGRFHFAKGFDTLPSVFEGLGEKYQLYAAGGARLENESDIVTPENVIKLGWLTKPQLQYLYNRVDFVIVPSRWEGFGFVPIEAMRASKAVIASSRGALPETVMNNVNGRLYDIEQSPRSALEAIKSLKKSDLSSYGHAGYELFINKFSSDIAAKNLFELYSRLLNEK